MLLDDASGAPHHVDAENAATTGFEDYLSSIEDTEEDQVEPEATPTQEDHESEPESEEVEADTEPADADEGTESDEPAEETNEADEEPSDDGVQLDPNLTVKVKVNGVEETVTLEELRKGYSRTKDYTQKTQAHAESVRTFEAEREKVVGERQMYAQRLQQLEQAITDATPQEPDWDKVQQDTPDQFPMLRAQWSLHKERLAALQAERQRAEQAVQQDQQAQQQQYLQAEQEKLIEALPEWKDAEKGKTARANMVAYVKNMGYSAEDIGRITDHRLIVLIDKAMKYDQAQARKPKITERIEKVKVVTPGPAKKAAPKPSKGHQALQRLAKSGRSEDAVAAFEAYLDTED
jgi:hypothetical protein